MNHNLVACLLTVVSGFSIAQTDNDIEFEKMLVDKSEFQKVLTCEDDNVKVKAIAFLLQKEGNIKINTTWYGFTDSISQLDHNASISTNRDKLTYCTNQFVALYLITAIYHSNTQFCQKIGIIYQNRKGSETETTNLKSKYCSYKKHKIKKGRYLNICYKEVDSKIIEQMFNDYNEWFNEVKNHGLDSVSSPVGETYCWLSCTATSTDLR